MRPALKSESIVRNKWAMLFCARRDPFFPPMNDRPKTIGSTYFGRCRNGAVSEVQHRSKSNALDVNEGHMGDRTSSFNKQQAL